MADRVLAVREPIAVAGTEVQTDVTIGIAVAGPGAGNPSTIVRHADQAMYTAKAAGGRATWCSPDRGPASSPPSSSVNLRRQ